MPSAQRSPPCLRRVLPPLAARWLSWVGSGFFRRGRKNFLVAGFQRCKVFSVTTCSRPLAQLKARWFVTNFFTKREHYTLHLIRIKAEFAEFGGQAVGASGDFFCMGVAFGRGEQELFGGRMIESQRFACIH